MPYIVSASRDRNEGAGARGVATYPDVMQAYVGQAALPVWLRLRESAGSIAANGGSSGATLNGTIAGAVTLAQSGQLGASEAMTFDGTTGKITVPTNAAINALQAFTYMAVFKVTDPGGGGFGNLWNWSNGHRLFFSSGGAITAIVARAGGNEQVLANAYLTLPMSAYIVLFVTFDTTNGLRMYRGENGAVSQIGTLTANTGAVTTQAADLVIANRSSSDRGLNGGLDEFAVFNQALTTTQMAELTRLLGY